ncbi:nicotinate-nucleotide--dimethylbenzimidazole phosphoribosyltransferase [Motiliproteus sp. MSK22-1]|uniref:nicotinate-nucleotide--dimethylbenzimidazole phosphoribosyltransferase n=1 Tax=Motiliproteus sp. MSK22-1 TaxID=1897630 RepID=UPI0009780EC6|nr:nicotinate-nucleotide--dimethylbenzimidazole phosphoribosyltransferase [Motiliproteus sp. MSK22-1]OMH30559.1 nicotinate-nucleotide--dimethylbenzimidazole phosphoribosyltransferase [Motiliproteus sp. MSK22-1]
MNSEWLNNRVKSLDESAETSARQRQMQLTKPPGSLGGLESLAIRLSAMQATDKPQVDKVHIAVFAADHGVTASGVSAFPQEVTVQMVANFSAGGAAISVLARSLGADLEVVDVGTVHKPDELPGVISHRAGAGTANLHTQDAMTNEQLAIALEAGRASVMRAREKGAELFIGGDMGIGNTTPAAAIASVLLSTDPAMLAGPGTGLDAAGVSHKASVLRQALARYQGLADQPLETLRCLGGFEIAALAGAYISCAQQGIPALVDGYITTAAALVAVRYQPAVKDWLIFSHRSAEPGHKAMLEAMGADPLLDLGMRLGEGSGAATTVPLVRLACELHNGMATFADAGVSEG